jgi:hypothetical protein
MCHDGKDFNILEEYKIKQELLHWCRKQFNNIKLCHMDCDVPDSEHAMFKLADEGNKKLCDKGVE